MTKFLAKWIAMSITLAAPQVFAQANGDKALDSLYERGQREMAPNWHGLGKTLESAVFVHKDVRKTESGLLSVWTHHELPAPGYIEKEKPYLSTRDRTVVDCKGARVGTTDIAYYSDRFGFGTVVGTERRKAELADVVPDSIEELLVKVVCAQKPRKAPAKAKTDTSTKKE
jgi:hypothetical protein